MIKAAIIPLGAFVLLATTPVAWAQLNPQESAVNEAVYRQANRITLRQKLETARNAQERGDLVVALDLVEGDRRHPAAGQRAMLGGVGRIHALRD